MHAAGEDMRNLTAEIHTFIASVTVQPNEPRRRTCAMSGHAAEGRGSSWPVVACDWSVRRASVRERASRE
ncbi:hypothetical protein ACWGLF_28825 [Streptomyces puniciscabiei]